MVYLVSLAVAGFFGVDLKGAGNSFLPVAPPACVDISQLLDLRSITVAPNQQLGGKLTVFQLDCALSVHRIVYAAYLSLDPFYFMTYLFVREPLDQCAYNLVILGYLCGRLRPFHKCPCLLTHHLDMSQLSKLSDPLPGP